MSRQSHSESRDSGWRSLALAGAIAGAIALMLFGGVGIIWLVGQGPAGGSTPGNQAPLTPTPRTLSFAHTTPAPLSTVQPAAPITTEETAPASAPAAVVATPDLLAMSAGASAAPAQAAILEGSGQEDFAALAANSWRASADMLVNDGSNAMAERWLTLASVPTADFAVEAELRVTLLLDTVCDQTFGLVGGSPGAGQVYGGGVIFPCSGGGPLARLTDVANWEDGYNADLVVAENAFDPGDDWHTYRFEVRGGEARLIVDGVGIATGAPAAPFDSAAIDEEAGIWSQGVGLEVRRVAVYPLPAP